MDRLPLSIDNALDEQPGESMHPDKESTRTFRTAATYCLPEWFRPGIIRTPSELDTIQADLRVTKVTQRAPETDSGDLDASHQPGSRRHEITQDQLSELQDIVSAALVPDKTGKLRESETGVLLTYADGGLDYCHQVLIQLAKDICASLITLDLEDLEDFAEQLDAQDDSPDDASGSSSDEPDRKMSFGLAKHFFAVPSKRHASKEAQARNKQAILSITNSLDKEGSGQSEMISKKSAKDRPVLLHLYDEKAITSMRRGYRIYARFWEAIATQRRDGEALVLIVSAGNGSEIYSGCTCSSCVPSSSVAKIKKKIRVGTERTFDLTQGNQNNDSKPDSSSQTGLRNLRHLKRMLRRRMPNESDPDLDWIQRELLNGLEPKSMGSTAWSDNDIQRAVTQIVGRLWRKQEIDDNDIHDILGRLSLYSPPVEENTEQGTEQNAEQNAEQEVAGAEDDCSDNEESIDPLTPDDDSTIDTNPQPEATNEAESAEEQQNSESTKEDQGTNAWPIEESVAKQEWEEQKRSRGDTNAALDDLMNMIGLESIKRRFMEIKNVIDTTNRQGINLKEDYLGCVFVGNPGTGKTMVAALYARLLSSFNIVPGQRIETTTGIDLGNGGISKCKKLVRKVEESYEGYNMEDGVGVILVDEAHELLNTSSGQSVLEYLNGEVERLRGKVVFVFTGYPRPMESFLTSSPGLQSRIPFTIRFDDYQDGELHQILVLLLKTRFGGKMRVEDGLNGLFMRVLVRRIGRSRGVSSFANARQIQNTLHSILTRQAQRLALSRGSKEDVDDLFLTKTDLIGLPPATALERSEAWKKLQKMTGLASVKENVHALFNQLQINYNRELAEQTLIECSLNKVFLGNPGTGKTTVAKYYGQILADIGLLSKGEVMVRTPADFIGSYLGHSENNTKSILAAARGKVLIIDEAYGLSGASDNNGITASSENPYKTAAVDTIVAEVQNTANEDRCVLLLGYKERMETMFQSVNPALGRRFPLSSAFNFEDYSENEMREILEMKLQGQGFSASEYAKEIAMGVLNQARYHRNYGNAGEVDILLDQAKIRQQKRLWPLRDLETDDLLLLEPQDFDPDFNRAQKPGNSIRQMMQDLVGADALVEKLEGYERIAKNAKALNLDPRSQIPFTFLFRGPPGTGKTTMARRMGQVFYNMGLLGSTEVIDCSTTDLIGEYVGHTGPKTKQLLQRALGKVLFIDEAYHLSESRFGRDAVVELMNLLTKDQYQDKVVVILAGYDEDIDRLLAINDGFSSRFPETISFDHITPLHSYELLIRSLQDKKLNTTTITTQPEGKMLQLLQKLAALPGWANARDVKALATSISRTVMKSPVLPPPPITDGAICDELDKMLNERQRRAQNAAKDSQRHLQRAKSTPADLPELDNLQQPTPTRIKIATATSKPKAAETKSATPIAIEDRLPSEQRETGVSDATWAQVQEAETQTRMRKAQINTIRHQTPRLEWEVARLKKAFAEARGDSAERDGFGVMLENAKQSLESEEAKLREAMSEAEKEAAIRERLLESGVCCLGYQWLKDGDGYRCAGGSHYKSNEEIFEEYHL